MSLLTDVILSTLNYNVIPVVGIGDLQHDVKTTVTNCGVCAVEYGRCVVFLLRLAQTEPKRKQSQESEHHPRVYRGQYVSRQSYSSAYQQSFYCCKKRSRQGFIKHIEFERFGVIGLSTARWFKLRIFSLLEGIGRQGVRYNFQPGRIDSPKPSSKPQVSRPISWRHA